jgi:hypothetical protein
MNSDLIDLVDHDSLDVADAEVVASVVVVCLRPYPRVSTTCYTVNPSMRNRKPMKHADAIGLDNSLADCA